MSQLLVPGLNRRVKYAIYDHVFAHDDHEVGGVLVGHLGDGALPVVSGSIAALEAEGRRASVTFTHEAWASIHDCLDRDFPGEQIVGWYHSHPGFGIFLSRYDRFIHQNFFSDSRQIAYVVDPHAGTEGIFCWQDSELVKLSEGAAGRAGTGGLSIRSGTDPADSLIGRVRADRRSYTAAAAAVLVLIALLAATQFGSGSARPHLRSSNSNALNTKSRAAPPRSPRVASARGSHLRPIRLLDGHSLSKTPPQGRARGQ